jgi:glycosyltransferase involved in cell wall biosynthesis
VLPGLFLCLRGFDIIHLHSPFIVGAEMTSLSAALSRVPLVVTYHNDLIGSGGWRDVVFRLATWSLHHLVLYRADRVLFVSQGHAETNDQRQVYYHRQASSRVLVNGVDTRIFCPGADQPQVRATLGFPADAPVIGFVSSLDRAHHYKGLDVLLRAMAMPELSHVYLLAVGDGEMKEQYRRQAHALGLSERAVFYGGVPQAELPPLLRACDVVAIPSLVPEALPLTLLESMACSIPVIASDGPGVRSVLCDGEDGLLAKPGDAANLVEKIQVLLDNPHRRREMGARGRAKVEAGYSWEQNATRLEAIYQEVLDSSTSVYKSYEHLSNRRFLRKS